MIEDIDALRENFRANITNIGLDEAQVVMANGKSVDVDESKPWATFLVTPGASREQGFDTNIRVLQTGFVMLQIHVPKGQGARLGYEIADKFQKLFLKWRERSGTGYVMTQVGYPRQVANPKFFQIDVFIPYDSVRMFPL